MNEWISVKNKLPPDDKDVLVCHQYSEGIDPDYGIAWFHKGDKKWEAGTEMIEASNYDGGAPIFLDIEPTHWMEIKGPPA